mmetsp:Transcript_46694/g.123327  ORF Transcript_46694/g.123327 Transcript_46694/m.123327 type:complete len:200 (+) Transcript_46694:225-824(+)
MARLRLVHRLHPDLLSEARLPPAVDLRLLHGRHRGEASGAAGGDHRFRPRQPMLRGGAGRRQPPLRPLQVRGPRRGAAPLPRGPAALRAQGLGGRQAHHVGGRTVLRREREDLALELRGLRLRPGQRLQRRGEGRVHGGTVRQQPGGARGVQLPLHQDEAPEALQHPRGPRRGVGHQHRPIHHHARRREAPRHAGAVNP